MTRPKVLVASDGVDFSKIDIALAKNGFDSFYAADGQSALNHLETWKPEFALIDLLLPQKNALSILDEIRRLNIQTEVIVVSGHSSPANVREVLARGATDYLVKPFTPNDLLTRLTFHLRKKIILEKTTPADEANRYLYLVDLILRQSVANQSVHEMLYKLSSMVGSFLKAHRVSFVQTQENGGLVVRASSDDPNFRDHEVHPNSYPEIVFVLNTATSVAIENINQDPAMAGIKKGLVDFSFNAIIVTPVFQGRHLWGVLSARMPDSRIEISNEDIRLTQIAAHVAGLRMTPALG